jgi:hypothetical protein
MGRDLRAFYASLARDMGLREQEGRCPRDIGLLVGIQEDGAVMRCVNCGWRGYHGNMIEKAHDQIKRIRTADVQARSCAATRDEGAKREDTEGGRGARSEEAGTNES